MRAVPEVVVERGTTVLRRRTHDAHRAIERATELPGSLRGIDDVVGLLGRWWLLSDELESRAGIEEPLLPAITSDLVALAADVPTSRGPAPASTPLPGRPERLGTAWVLLGARLGLATLARPVAELVGRPLLTFTRHDPSPLHDVRAEIDELDPAMLERAGRAAQETFDTASAVLGGPPWDG